MQTFIAIDPSAENEQPYTVWICYEIDAEGNITVLETAATLEELTNRCQIVGGQNMAIRGCFYSLLFSTPLWLLGYFIYWIFFG